MAAAIGSAVEQEGVAIELGFANKFSLTSMLESSATAGIGDELGISNEAFATRLLDNTGTHVTEIR